MIDVDAVGIPQGVVGRSRVHVVVGLGVPTTSMHYGDFIAPKL